MRALQEMSQYPVYFDLTHSNQRPIASSSATSSQGNRSMTPLLARSAVSTGYLSGLFMEVHPNPQQAASDTDTQLTIKQSKALCQQIDNLFKSSREFTELDSIFA